MPEHILTLSYGKDSLACLGAIEKLGWPLDRIVHAEVWATDTTPADLPQMVEFKAKADEIIFERFGLKVEHYCATNVDGVKKEKVSYQDVFYHVIQKGKHSGSIKGFPMIKGQWCQKLKLNAISNAIKDRDAVQYLGIAADEPKRFGNLNDTKRSPLVEAGWTEAMCREWCEKNDLLSPIYTTGTRGGCWFCHNQGIDQLRLMRRSYPNYWEMMLKWDTDSPVCFNPSGHTLHDYEKRFKLEDEGLIDQKEYFRWDILKYPIQLRLF